MTKVLVTQNIPDKASSLLQDAGLDIIVLQSDKTYSESELIAICQEVDLILNVGQVRLNKSFLESCTHLKGIALASVGYDHVDIEAATALGIPVSNTPDVLSGATADVAFLLMLAVSRDAFNRSRDILDGAWKGFEFTKKLGVELNGKVLGIFGLGRIGIELAKKAKAAYNMRIIYHNRNRNIEAEKTLEAQYVTFDELLAQSDVLSVHTNLSDETRYKFNHEAFEKMKPSAIFINTARGAIHHEKDLTNALLEGKIWGAGLDVTDPEPMDSSNPLLRMPQVCVLPHIGSGTVETRTAMAEMAAQNIVAVIRKQTMPQVVNSLVYR